MNTITNKMKNLASLTRLLIYLRLKNRKISRHLSRREAELSDKEKELNLYINKFLGNEQRWAAINYINKNINSTLTTQSIFDFINNELVNLLDIDFCVVSLFDDVCKKFVLHYKESLEPEEHIGYLNNFLSEGFCLDIDSDIEQSVITKILNNNLKKGFKAVPLMNMTKMFGVMFVYKDEEEITEEHFQVINMIADNIAGSLVNAHLYSKMQMSNKRKLEFIAYMSHEFKTPLNAIIGFTALMQSSEIPREKQNKFFNNIMNASKHLLQVAESTMDMARAESDKLKLFYEEFCPANIISEVLYILGEKINQKGIHLSTNLSKDIIAADKRRFKQLIYNLVSNAIKFNKNNGDIEITTYCADENFYFEIRDTGEGIAPDEQDKIFEFFSHIEKKKFENEDGSGIGLSLCKKIINLHNGEINFKSEYNKGSIFWYSIPVKAPVLSEMYEKILD